jgi:uncharacterized protein YciI
MISIHNTVTLTSHPGVLKIIGMLSHRVFLVLVIACTAFAQKPAPPAPKEALPPNMKIYQMVFMRANATQQKTPDPQQTVAGHLAYLAKLNRERTNLLYGPFLDGGDLVGMMVLDVADADAARRIMSADPHLQPQKFVLDVKPWLGPEDAFHLPSSPHSTEQFVFGVYTRGPDRSQPPEEAEKIQAAHLAYQAELHKAGKLVVAGPFMEDADWRGVVIYRVPSIEDAKTLAAADPAVKAGRLVLVAWPWMTFKGIIE